MFHRHGIEALVLEMVAERLHGLGGMGGRDADAEAGRAAWHGGVADGGDEKAMFLQLP
jgi:hypothetical protein